MRLAKQIGCIHVPFFDGADHVFMLGDVALGQAIGERLVIEAQQPAPFIEKPRKEGGVEGIATRFSNSGVKIAVGRDHFQRIL